MNNETLAAMLRDAGLSHAEAARRIGIAERSLRRMLAGERRCDLTISELRERLHGIGVMHANNYIDRWQRLNHLLHRIDTRATALILAGKVDDYMSISRRRDRTKAQRDTYANAMARSPLTALRELREWAELRGKVAAVADLDEAIRAWDAEEAQQ